MTVTMTMAEMTKRFKEHGADCPHDRKSDGVVLHLATETDDVAFLVELHSLPTDTQIVRCCFACHNNLPSWVAVRARNAERAARRATEAQHAAAERLSSLHGSGDTIYKCPICEEPFGEEDAIPIRVCPIESCWAETFANFDRNCTECNRPFTRLVTTLGHESCGDEYDEDAGDPELWTDEDEEALA